MFKLTGTIKVIMETNQVTDSFKKREFVVTDNSSMYPQDILFQLTQDKCGLIEGFNAGELVDVNFNVRGREWTSPQGDVRYFVSLDAWRVDRSTGATPAPTGNYQQQAPAAPSAPVAPKTAEFTSEDEDDGLPF